jgi:hypothetical protein
MQDNFLREVLECLPSRLAISTRIESVNVWGQEFMLALQPIPVEFVESLKRAS